MNDQREFTEQTHWDDLARRGIDLIDQIIIPLIWYNTIILAIECDLYPDSSSRESHPFFLWSERVVATIFTVEYVLRCRRNSGRGFYPVTPFGIIDLLAIVPFWIGFVPALSPYLHLVRTLRLVRMLKLFRYSRGLQVMMLGFYRAYFNLRPLLLTALMVILFTMFSLYQIEGAQQEEFRDLFTVGWFLEVTGTTVGYGDLSPQTTGGRAIVMLYMIVGLAIFMACFSAITSAFDQVFEQAEDPEFQPLDQFRVIREKQEELEELYKDIGTTADEDAMAEEEAEREPIEH
ncbi:MAG: ion transporter [Planctomycetaceae bacterium]|nr:ion transporter [Planctomycetaceae bacterium]